MRRKASSKLAFAWWCTARPYSAKYCRLCGSELCITKARARNLHEQYASLAALRFARQKVRTHAHWQAHVFIRTAA
eukprot:4164121-Pleurochrysis_carterae.AAC.2